MARFICQVVYQSLSEGPSSLAALEREATAVCRAGRLLMYILEGIEGSCVALSPVNFVHHLSGDDDLVCFLLCDHARSWRLKPNVVAVDAAGHSGILVA